VARKLVKLNIKETSGVDHPAHLTEGWVVMKSANASDVTAVLDELRPVDEVIEAAPTVDEMGGADEATEIIEATKSATADEVFTHPVSKEETMPNTSEMAEVVIIPEAASEAEIIKAMPAAIRKMLDEASANADAALRKAAASEAALIAEREARADEAAVIKASQWSFLNIDPTIVGPALRRLAETDGVLANEVVKALDSANEISATNAVFTEVGTDAPVAADDAFSKMESLAKSLVADGVAPSFEAALLSVAQTNADLYTQYLNEKAGR
jgi:hypothetical protein